MVTQYRKQPGLEVRGPTRMQVQRMFAAVGMEPEPLGKAKPLLRDASDLFAYIAARAVSSKPSSLGGFPKLVL